ncbi:MAG: peptidoglycan-binding protein [Clostridiales bacterium]|nr:peptidoglycan-binding protein [Clostridiales bacterium]
MKQRTPGTTDQKTRIGRSKRVAILLMLVLSCWILSSCYIEEDPLNDPGNILNTADQQDFQSLLTPTPSPSPTPGPATDAPAATDAPIDWSQWNFNNTEATSPPSNISPTIDTSGNSGSTIGTIVTNPPTTTSSTGGSGVIAVTTATPKPSATGSSSSSSTSTVMKNGSKGSSVKNLQQRLKELGYYTGSVDGSFGSGTETAVKAFQTAHKLTSDGKVGDATSAAVYSKNAKSKSSTSTSTSSSSNPSSSSSSSSSSYTNGKTDTYLKLGSSGSQVKIMQNRLIVLGYLSGTADGDFAETTEAAVISFQNRNSIYADGVAGPTTLTKLYSSSAKKASSVVANLGTLESGVNGSGVRALQQQLKTLGYYTGSIDGDFGSGTTSAVMSFQAASGLKQDGKAGKATMNAIYAALNGTSTGSGNTSTSGSSKTSPATYGTSASSNGYSTISASSGNSSNVTALQSALSSTGYYNGSLDGDFGSGTTDAVSSYQRAKGLRVTGMAGPSTQRILYGGTSESGSYSKLEPGDNNSKVKTLQYALYELKYYDGNITGTYDQATENAVRVFQEVNGLDMDGVAGQQTQQKLYSSNAKPCNI